MFKIKDLISLLFLLSLTLSLPACIALQSTVNAIGRNVSSAFRSPRKIDHKVSNPYRPDARLAVLWIGHASVLIQIDDKFILTDPVLTTTVGQFSKRLVEPGIRTENIPPIDAVLISHMHIDHYSPASIAMLEKKIKKMLIPQGAFAYIPNFDLDIEELPSGTHWENEGLRITAVPVIHNGWRYGLDGAWMRTSYTGYLVDYKGVRVYIGGDTAYDSLLFRETGRQYPAIDLAVLPVAPIHPREYSRARHTDPAEALQIMEDLGAAFLLPMHYDTFPESIDTLGEAVTLLSQEIERRQFDPARVVIPEIGELKVIIKKQPGEIATAALPLSGPPGSFRSHPMDKIYSGKEPPLHIKSSECNF